MAKPVLWRRMALAILLMVGFYALALGIAAILVYLPYAEYHYLGRIEPRLVLFGAAGAIAILIAIAPRVDRFEDPGPLLEPAQHPQLFQLIQETATATAQAPPSRVYLVPDFNCLGVPAGWRHGRPRRTWPDPASSSRPDHYPLHALGGGIEEGDDSPAVAVPLHRGGDPGVEPGDRSAPARAGPERQTRQVMPRLLLAGAILSLLPGVLYGVQDAPELLRNLTAQVKADGSLIWSRRRLAWKDFHGAPRLGGSTAAQTSSGVTYVIECHGENLRFAVLATFSPTESWVRPDIPNNRTASPRTLFHEQTHFDITEVFARRLRKAFASASGICPNHPKDARKLFEHLSRESQSQQNDYDDHTAHGMALDSQTRWNRSVASSLDSLAAYRQD